MLSIADYDTVRGVHLVSVLRTADSVHCLEIFATLKAACGVDDRIAMMPMIGSQSQ